MELKYIVADWKKHRKELSSVRHEVFVKGQNVPEELEIDGLDDRCSHILALADGKPVGTARLTPDGHIGRVAVLREFRQYGIGREIMKQIEEIAFETGFDRVELSAQLHAIPFYEKLGYTTCGEVFLDAGIEHRHMKKSL